MKSKEKEHFFGDVVATATKLMMTMSFPIVVAIVSVHVVALAIVGAVEVTMMETYSFFLVFVCLVLLIRFMLVVSCFMVSRFRSTALKRGALNST